MKIDFSETLAESDRSALVGWSSDPFETTSFALEWRAKGWHFIARDDAERPLSKVSVLMHQLQAGDEWITVGGVGGVITIPEAQRRGLARMLLREAESFMREKLEVDFGFLFCIDARRNFYERQGWRAVTPVWFDQARGRILSPVNTLILPLTNRTWPAGEVNLRSLPW